MKMLGGIKMIITGKEFRTRCRNNTFTGNMFPRESIERAVPSGWETADTHEAVYGFTFKAFEHPGLIEVEEKKYKIKLLNGYLYNVSRNLYKIADRINYGDIFTQSEIDVLQKQEQFKAIDLNKCKEEVE